MSSNDKPKKHRHRRHYTIMIIAGDSDGENKRIHLGHVKTQILAFSAFAIVLAIICYIVYTSMTLSALKDIQSTQTATIAELETDNATLEADKTELQTEIDHLSYALNQKVQEAEASAAEAEEQSMPTGFPLSGTAAMESTYDDPDSSEIVSSFTSTDDDEDEDEEDDETTDEATEETSEEETVTGNPIVIFSAEAGANVVASGNGTVASVTSDIKYGNCVTIDHGNGYVSIYRNQGDALVNEGDTVLRGSILFVVGDDNSLLGYQIKNNDEYVDAEALIDISG